MEEACAMVAGGDEFNNEGHCFPGCLDLGVVLKFGLLVHIGHQYFIVFFMLKCWPEEK